jgi:peroxiredoxin
VRFAVNVLVVSQAQPEVLAAFLHKEPLDFPAAADPERAAYRAFGLERTSWAAFFRPQAVRRYLSHLVHGWLPQGLQRGEDVLQLGGDFILDGDGRLVYAHRSSEPTDRPPAEALLQILHDLSPPASEADVRASTT